MQEKKTRRGRAATGALERAASAQQQVRSRIIGATFELLMERGYEGTSTLEIATRARVSKRDIYALFGNKRGILMHMIATGAARMQLPLHLPEPEDRRGLATILRNFGATLLREVSSPIVVAFYRLAASEADRSTEVAAALDTSGRQATSNALADLLRRAQARGLLGRGDTARMAAQFFALLWTGDLLLGLVLRLADAPSAAEAQARAKSATGALLALYPVEPGR
jgi:AcrR family transcriptional regulator